MDQDTFKTGLTERGAVAVNGTDSEKLLQSVISNDVAAASPAHAVHAGLLSPQGKILFEFFVVRTTGGFLLDIAKASAPDLVKRLTLYKLRADVSIEDRSHSVDIGAVFGVEPPPGSQSYVDTRDSQMGFRFISSKPAALPAAVEAYDARRIMLGVAEGGRDYDFGDAYPHEANFDLANGVSFTKGCYIGQEIVARMQHKTTVRKRIVRVVANEPLPADRPNIVAADVVIGRLGSVSGKNGLALLRLDRAEEFAGRGLPPCVGTIALSVLPPAGAIFSTTDAARP